MGIWLKLSVLVFVYVVLKSTPSQPTWAIILVLFAALFLVPIGFHQINQRQSMFRIDDEGLILHMPCVLFLAISFLLDRSILAGIFALPYATWCVETFLRGLKIEKNLVYITTATVFVFLAIGSIWLLFDRFGIQPLGFSNWIVILTGVHFHYAGFTLVTSLILFLYQKPDNRWTRIVTISVIIGVFFTALGISLTQSDYGHIYETIAGVWMGSSTIAAGCVLIKNSLFEKRAIKILWSLAGICLILAMILAFLYALRSVIPLDILTLPFMQTVHGTLNALGFGTLMLVGWALKKSE